MMMLPGSGRFRSRLSKRKLYFALKRGKLVAEKENYAKENWRP